MTLILTACEAELTKIADWKMRAGEAALGALAGAGTGYALARDKDKVHNDEAAAALAGAVLGAGGGLGLSAVIRSLQARALVNKELPAALEAGKLAMKPQVEAAQAAKKALGAAEKAAPKTPPILRPNVDKILNRAHGMEVASGELEVKSARKGLKSAEDALRDATRQEASASRQSFQVDLRDELSRMDMLPWDDSKGRGKVGKRLRRIREGMDAESNAIYEGRIGPKAQGSAHMNDLEEARKGVEAAHETLERMRNLAHRREQAVKGVRRIQGQQKAVEDLKGAETALAEAKAAYQQAAATHGPSKVTEGVRTKAHDTYAQKLFGLIG